MACRARPVPVQTIEFISIAGRISNRRRDHGEQLLFERLPDTQRSRVETAQVKNTTTGIYIFDYAFFFFNYHSFSARIPKDTELRLKWLKFIRSIDRHFIMKPSHLLCENHFFDSEYSIPTTSLKKQKKLKKNAVPSVVGIICIGKFQL